MKAVQVTLDEHLLRRMDALPEVRRDGRSKFLRRLVESYLGARREREIQEAYRRGYGAHPASKEEFYFEPELLKWPED